MIRSAVIEALAVVLWLAPAPARADDVEEARHRFLSGEEQYARGSYEEAYASYEAAYRAAPLPDFLFNMGQCQRNLGNPSAALVLYRRFLAMNPPEERRVIVEGIVRDILITSPEADTPPEGSETTGAGQDGTVPARGGASDPDGPRAGRPFFARLRAPTWVVTAGAVVLAGAGGLFALRAQSGQNELDALDCERQIHACLEARDAAEPWFLARNITLAAGGAALGLAIVLAIVDAGADEEPDRVTLSPALSPHVAGFSAVGRF